MPCVAEVVNRSLKADCTDFTAEFVRKALKQLFFVSIVVITAESMSCIHIKQLMLGVNEIQHVPFILDGMN